NATCASTDAHPSKPHAVSFLDENLNTLLQWVRFFVFKGEHVDTSAALFKMLISKDDPLRHRITSSRKVTDLFLSLWTRKDNDRRYFVIFKYELCPLLDLLNGFLKNDVGKSHIFALLDEPRSIGTVAKTVCGQIQQLTRRHLQGECSWKFTILHFLKLLRLTSQLLRTHRDWSAFFGSRDLLRILMKDLWLISKRKNSPDSWRMVFNVLRYISEFTLDAPLGTYPALLKVKAVVEGGMIHMLTDCILHIPDTSRDNLTAVLILQHLAAYSIYHEVSSLVPIVTELVKTMKCAEPAGHGTQMSKRDEIILIISCAVAQTTAVHRGIDFGPRQLCDGLNVCIC
ncbi:hypothetical protein EST38_g14463, partial [Candolleomyces aberdarensis]